MSINPYERLVVSEGCMSDDEEGDYVPWEVVERILKEHDALLVALSRVLGEHVTKRIKLTDDVVQLVVNAIEGTSIGAKGSK